MKPSEMSTSRLSAAIDHWLLELNIENTPLNELVEEMETRLRNSIPKPVVEVRKTELIWDDYEVVANGCQVYCGPGSVRAKNYAKLLRTALGINDTEGGE